MDKQARFKAITTKMSELYKAKNHDYGDAFGQTFAELGIISAITRISDKTNRLKSLATKDQRVDDERIEDTLMDLANYAVMTLIELQDNDDTQPIKTELPMKPIAGVYKSKVYKGRWNLLRDLRHDGFKWLARDENSDLYAFKRTPKKYEIMEFWETGANDCSLIIKDNFPEVKWTDDEPTRIDVLLAFYLNGGENGK